MEGSNSAMVLIMYKGVQHMKNSNTTANNIFITRFLLIRLFSAFVRRSPFPGFLDAPGLAKSCDEQKRNFRTSEGSCMQYSHL